MKIGQMRETDVPRVALLMAAYYAHDGIPFAARLARRRLRALLRRPALGAGWLLIEAGVAEGYVIVTRGFGLEHGANVEIDECYLTPAFRGRGWGRQILRRVEAYARRVGAESLHAQVERRNRGACGFWMHLGFRRYDRCAMVRLLRSVSSGYRLTRSARNAPAEAQRPGRMFVPTRTGERPVRAMKRGDLAP